MRITSKGQVTIPKHIRDAAGLAPNTEAEFEIVEGGAVIRPASAFTRQEALERWLRTVPGRHKLLFTSDEVMAMTRGED